MPGSQEITTQEFLLLPWDGGLNTSLDPGVISPKQLTKAEHCVFATNGARSRRDGINYNWDDAATGTERLLGGIDFWFGVSNEKDQTIVTVSDDKKFYSYDPGAGTRTEITDIGSAWSSSITDVSLLVFDNKLLLAATGGTSNSIKYWDGASDIDDLGNNSPAASILQEHLGRVWTNDLSNPDRIHYSQTHDLTQWGGNGDSGALDVGVGDGDPVGITAIFPSFQGALFVAKKTKLYRVSGTTPEDFTVTLVSSGIGCISQNAQASVDQTDVFFASDRGFHSLATTASYGDFTSQYVSFDIQKTFLEKFPHSQRPFIKAAYIAELNSVAFAVTDRQFTPNQNNNCVYLYNISLKSWYLWPDVPAQCLFMVQDSDKKRMYVGTNISRLAQTQTGLPYDTLEDDSQQAIGFDVKSGVLFLDQNPYSLKRFHRFGLIYQPQGANTLIVTLQIDNYAPQVLTYDAVGSQFLLGETFILGQTPLGFGVALGPYVQSFDGYGRGISVRIQQVGIDAPANIQGFFIAYEPAEVSAETRTDA